MESNIDICNLKELLAKQAALVYNLIRKVIGMEFPIALSKVLNKYKKN